MYDNLQLVLKCKDFGDLPTNKQHGSFASSDLSCLENHRNFNSLDSAQYIYKMLDFGDKEL